MGNAILFRMPSGIPGDISRQSQATVEPGVLNSASAFPGYGLFGKVSSGKFVPVGAGDTAAVVYGLLVRPYPTVSSQDPLGTSTPPTTGMADILRRGYMTVKNNAGTPAVRFMCASQRRVLESRSAVSKLRPTRPTRSPSPARRS
jgi:hypothetical protein